MTHPRPPDGRHTVVAGEWASSIAHAYGIEDWKESVWNDANNSDLQVKRDPYVLAPADKVFIPEIGTKRDDAATTKRHTYQIGNDRDVFRLRLVGRNGAPLKDTDVHWSYTAMESAGVADVIRTNADGYIKIQCPRDTIEIRIRYQFHDPAAKANVPCSAVFDMGHLRPMREDDDEQVRALGVQARLRGLGFMRGPLSGEVDPQTLAAVRGFRITTANEAYRARYNLSAALKDSYAIDEDLTNALIKAYGS